ncbi:hypothetical protein F4677DRAFT_445016 [Hypoxylon crocopeplum]|nr:hypothetical protein F4677DRAFT_445016 [Hypoxylon crocopeplum]
MSTKASASTAPPSKQTGDSKNSHRRHRRSSTKREKQQEQQPTTKASPAENQGDRDAEADTDEDTKVKKDDPCPCGCHENTAQREGRPWIAFSNAAYLVCPLCWVDAYMHDGGWRGLDCDGFLRGRGLDPKVPASRQC